ncbi:MAG TPA: DUF4344 domain-containing metallopeptidase [Pyrinomonadaceae bacterium]
MSKLPHSIRQNAFNLLMIFVMLIFGFGCVCSNLGDDDRNRGKNLTNSPQTQSNTTGKQSNKGRTKANTQTTTTKRSTEEDKGDFQVEYVDVENPAYERLNQEMRQEKILESASRDLNKALALPYDITLVTKDCGQINAFYQPSERSITICYEMMEFYSKLFGQKYNQEEANQKMAEALQFIFLHELGHALIDAYQLPVTGNEEDAADKLSSYINIKELGESGGGARAAIAAAQAFGMQSEMTGNKDLPFYDEHALDQQRFYNILCQLFGSNPNKYEVLVKDGTLPEPRAVRCPSEFQQNVRTWENLLAKYRKQ